MARRWKLDKRCNAPLINPIRLVIKTHKRITLWKTTCSPRKWFFNYSKQGEGERRVTPKMNSLKYSNEYATFKRTNRMNDEVSEITKWKEKPRSKTIRANATTHRTVPPFESVHSRRLVEREHHTYDTAERTCIYVLFNSVSVYSALLSF